MQLGFLLIFVHPGDRSHDLFSGLIFRGEPSTLGVLGFVARRA
jgi:hypothetical protein